MNRYTCDADDFYVNMNLNTEMELPTSRDTVLHYFEQMKKAFPELRNFYTRESGDLVLEGDKEQESYRWLAIEPRRLCSGQVNPETLEDAYRQHEMVLELAPHLLTISVLDCEALDVMYGFDFTYDGNHDEVVAEALGVGPRPGGAARGARGRGSSTSSRRSRWPSTRRAGSSAGSRSRPAPTPTRSGRASSPRTRSASTSRSASTGGRAPIGPSSTRSAASARSARRSSRTR